MQLSDYTAMARGMKSRLARKLGVPPQLMGQWAMQRRPVPIERCVAIEKATLGAVSRKDLRPDDWHLIWPDLDEPVGEMHHD